MLRGGNRIVADESRSGKGNQTITYPVFQTGLRISSHDGPITFKYRIYGNKNFTPEFKLYKGEVFDEDTEPFRELQIIANATDRWDFTSYVDIDGPGPYLVSSYDEFSD